MGVKDKITRKDGKESKGVKDRKVETEHERKQQYDLRQMEKSVWE